MEKWLESVYSDGSECFVSSVCPKYGESVTISLRVYDDAPIKSVHLRTLRNGMQNVIDCAEAKRENGFVYYSAELKMTENRMHYHFIIVSEDTVYFYNQKEITTYVPEDGYDFVLLCDYVQPEWVKSSVFYQIFPDRFYNGDTASDVKTGEYSLNGFDCIKMEDWNDEPLDYEHGHCLDFYGGDLQGVKAKMPYLKSLGVTAVYLNPIFRAPSVHKYDCIDYFHVDPHFGGDEALAELSAALHENGMKLIVDISINHTGTAHRWFNRDGLFFPKTEGAYNNPGSDERSCYFFGENNSYMGWAGISDLPTLNYSSEKLREVIYKDKDSVLRKWLKPPYSIDGWRFDVADVFARNDELQLSHELWPEIRSAIREENPQAYILAEHWADCSEYLQGSEWDSAMNYYGCARVLRQFLGQNDLYLGWTDNIRNSPYKMTAQDVKVRITQHLSRMPFVLQQNQFNLIDSHDTPRTHNDPKVNRDELRGAVMLMFALIGTPSIYYGDEADIGGILGTNEGCRYPLPWDSGFEESETYGLYSTLAGLRGKSSALTKGGMKIIYAEGRVFALARFYGDEIYVVIMSASDKPERVKIPFASVGANGTIRDIFGSTPELVSRDGKDAELLIPPHKAYFLDCSI